MSAVREPPLYDDLLNLLAQSADAQDVLGFRLSAKKQRRLDALLQRNREGTLSAAESVELDDYERFEHVVRLLKARVARKQEA